MLNFNQNIIRQLNKIYGISFKEKYKEEIKNRIINFVSNLILNEANGNLFEKINQKSNLFVINENKINLLTKDFFKEYKTILLNSFNPLWYENKIKVIYTKREKEKMIIEMFNSFAEKYNFEINEKIYKEMNYKIEENLMIKKRFVINSQCSLLNIDKKIIKKYFSNTLEKRKNEIIYSLLHLNREIIHGCYSKKGVEEKDIEMYKSFKNLIIEEIDEKMKKRIYNISIGYDKTSEIKTGNNIQTKIIVKYAVLNRYIEIIDEILK